MLDLRALLLLSLFAAGCGSIDPAPPTDEDGNEIVSPGPFDTYLTAEAAYPAEVGSRPVLRVVFDTFIDDDQLLDFSVISLTSGGISASGRVRWVLSSRTLEFRPTNALVPGLVYRPVLDATRLRSVTGAPLGPTVLPEFTVNEDDDVAEDDQGAVRWSDVAPIFEAKCASCHADPQWQLNPLTRDSLLGRTSDQSDALLVVPFDAADSYLIHKIVPDYPIRRFTIQPPPWSDGASLTADELRVVERWVETGARQ